MSATVSDFFQKVVVITRNGWPPWFGINGHLAPDYANCFAIRDAQHQITYTYLYFSSDLKISFLHFSSTIINIDRLINVHE